jgi:hypothetical protein
MFIKIIPRRGANMAVAAVKDSIFIHIDISEKERNTVRRRVKNQGTVNAT